MSIAHKNLMVSCIGVTLIALIIGVYVLLPYEKSSVDRIVFAGAISSIVIAFAALLIFNTVSRGHALISASGGYAITTLYWAISSVLSLLFGCVFRNAVTAYQISMCVLLAGFLIADILVYFGARMACKQEEQTECACLFFKTMECKLELLSSNRVDEELFAALSIIKDAIKSCDQSTLVEADEQLGLQLDALISLLSQPTIEVGKALLAADKAMTFIEQRSIDVQLQKTGGV